MITELAEKQGNTAASDVYDWFNKHLMIIKPGAVYSAIPFAFMVDKKFTDEVTGLLKDMDFDFEGFEIASRRIDINYIMSQVGGDAEYREKLGAELESSKEGFWDSPWSRYAMIQKTADGKFSEKTLLLKHKRKDGGIAFLTIDEASSGFRRMLDLVILLMDGKMMQNTTAVIDEIEQSLHTVISKSLIEELKRNSIDKNCNSQLIFITHDTNLLDGNLMRRDQIWFTQLDHERSSDLYSLSEVRAVRKSENLAKGYMSGKYGAMPMLNGTILSQICAGQESGDK